ncbi:MAG: hypothetical protein PHR71_11405 [Polaromonas sp.]|nr:hypothetical protein [Polaromonas sp.]
MGFQRTVNLTPAPAVAGDFASANPRATVLAGPGGLVAGVGGVTVGKFAWVDDDGLTVLSHGTATRAPNGFVHREQQALIQTYLAESGMNIPVGFPVTLHNEGDFWATLTGANAATIGAAIYADYDTGDVTAVAASTGASVTAIMGSTNTGSLGSTFTATGTGTSFAVTALTGYLAVGDEISGTGVVAGTTITAQVSGTTGEAGTYTTSAATTSAAATVTSFGSTIKTTSTTGLISIGETVSGGAGFPVGATVTAQVSGTTGGAGVYTLSDAGSAYVASATGVTTFGNVLNVTAIGSGTLHVGDPVSGTGVPSGAVIASQVSGTTGGVGVYTLDQSATAYAASTTVTAVAGVLTSWKAQSVAAVGELVKISTWG